MHRSLNTLHHASLRTTSYVRSPNHCRNAGPWANAPAGWLWLGILSKHTDELHVGMSSPSSVFMDSRYAKKSLRGMSSMTDADCSTVFRAMETIGEVSPLSKWPK